MHEEDRQAGGNWGFCVADGDLRPEEEVREEASTRTPLWLLEAGLVQLEGQKGTQGGFKILEGRVQLG